MFLYIQTQVMCLKARSVKFIGSFRMLIVKSSVNNIIINFLNGRFILFDVASFVCLLV